MTNADDLDRVRAVLTSDLAQALERRQRAVAQKLGIGVTDLACLLLVRDAGRDGSITAGGLAEGIGVTTGAITGALDRLEAAGYVRREKDPADRRQVRVAFVDTRGHVLDAIDASLRGALANALGEHDLEASHGLLTRMTDALDAESSAMLAPSTAASFDATTPLRAQKEATLEFPRGAHDVVLETTSDPVLYRASHAGTPPTITETRDLIRIVPPGPSLKSMVFGQESFVVALSDRVAWTLAFKKGVANLRGDLRAGRLAGLEVNGGVHKVALALPVPSGTALLKIQGGVHDLALTRPRGASLRLHLRGGANQLVLDSARLGAVGGEMRWESPEFGDASDRYDVVIAGGVNRLSITAV